MLLPQLCWLLAALLPPAPAQKFSALTFLRVDQDKDKDCSLDCGGSAQKPLCASDGRTFLSRCEFQRAKCKDPQLEIAYRGSCKDVSRCVAERKYTQEQARKELQQVFIPECNEDGTYSQVQCHSYTGYCWCVTPNGRPISGTAVAHKTPRCPGSVNEKLPQRESTGKTDDASAPALETQPQGDEEDIASRYPTLWTEQVKSRQNKTNKNSVSSCDQEQQSALEEARQPKNDNVVIPECAHGGLYKPVQCHPSTGYCWCVLVDTGRPIPGTSTRYEQPKCDNTARAHPARTRDLYRSRQLQGCPGAKKNEFLTSVLDALSTDMVHAVSDPSSALGTRPQPHAGGAGGALVLQAAGQKLQRGRRQKGDQALQEIPAEEVQAQEVREEVRGVLRRERRQVPLHPGADGLPGRHQGGGQSRLAEAAHRGNTDKWRVHGRCSTLGRLPHQKAIKKAKPNT
uniref:SPARC related modular calcium binding 2 n=1 Tax=Sus scrofa TaxID=9823 RepID=A0A8D1ESR1_PIG